MFLSYRVSDGQQIVCCADTKRDYNKNAGKSIAKFAEVQKNMPTEGKIRGSTQRILSCSFKGNMIYSQQKVSGKQTHKLSRNKKTD